MPLKFASLNPGCHFCYTTDIQIVCRDVSKKARDRDKRYGTDGYKSRKRSSTRWGSCWWMQLTIAALCLQILQT